MPVPVADEDVHQSGCEKGARVDPVSRAVLEMLEELFGPCELGRARESGLVVRWLRRALLDHAELEARADAVEPRETRVVG